MIKKYKYKSGGYCSKHGFGNCKCLKNNLTFERILRSYFISCYKPIFDEIDKKNRQTIKIPKK